MCTPRFVLAAVGTTFLVLLMTCVDSTAQTTSVSDFHWAVRTQGTLYFLGAANCAPLQHFSQGASEFETDADLIVPRQRTVAQGGAVQESVDRKRIWRNHGIRDL